MRSANNTISMCCVISLVLLHSSVDAFSLKVSVSSRAPLRGATVNFTCVPTGGVPPYNYSWDFDDMDGYKNPSTVQNPSHRFNWVGRHIVTVTVKDATAATEQGVLIIEVRGNPGVVKNAKTDCGCVGDGLTDDGPALRACIEAFSTLDGGRIEFPEGTYLIDAIAKDFESVDKRWGIILKYIRKVEFVGTGALQPILLFRVGHNYDNDGKEETFFSYDSDDTAPNYFLAHNLHFKYDTKAQTDYDVCHLIAGFLNSPDEYVTFENCTIENYTSLGQLGNVRFRKNNVTHWGMPNNIQCIYLQGNSILKQNYISRGSTGHSHLIYSGGTSDGTNRDFVFIIENYLDGANGYDNAWGLHFYGEDGSTLQYKYVRGNLIKGTTKNAVIMGVLGNPKINSQHIEVTNNILVDRGITIYRSQDDIVIQNNHFQNVDGYCLRVGRFNTDEANGIIFINNTLGYGAGSDGGGTIEFVSENYGKIFAPNRDDATRIDVSDPGPWEYYPPMNSSISINNGVDSTASTNVTLILSASDVGSGMGNRPRFPFKQGALMQFSNDGVVWSELRPYVNRASWKLNEVYGKKNVFARFSDVAGNWSETVLDTIFLTVGKPPAPKNLRIVR